MTTATNCNEQHAQLRLAAHIAQPVHDVAEHVDRAIGAAVRGRQPPQRRGRERVERAHREVGGARARRRPTRAAAPATAGPPIRDALLAISASAVALPRRSGGHELADERLARGPDEREAHAEHERADREVDDGDRLRDDERAERHERRRRPRPARSRPRGASASGRRARRRTGRTRTSTRPCAKITVPTARFDARELERDHAVHDGRHEEREERGERAEPEHAERRDRERRERLVGPAPQRGRRTGVRALCVHGAHSTFCENRRAGCSLSRPAGEAREDADRGARRARGRVRGAEPAREEKCDRLPDVRGASPGFR